MCSGGRWGVYALRAGLHQFLGGGERTEVVTRESSPYAPPPYRFEAGTPPIAQAVGLGAAIEYLEGVGMEWVAAHETEITAYALAGMASLPGVRVLGPTEAVDRGGAVSFTLSTTDGLEIHPHDVMQLMDARGIAVRGGHHCARPLHARLGITASSRASSYLYTTTGEIDALIDGLAYVQDFFGRRA